jgi:hypothetical protein
VCADLTLCTRAVTERPPTPVARPLPQNRELLAAVVLLQRLLRGRAVQSEMYEGRVRRQDLIDELKHTSTGACTLACAPQAQRRWPWGRPIVWRCRCCPGAGGFHRAA